MMVHFRPVVLLGGQAAEGGILPDEPVLLVKVV